MAEGIKKLGSRHELLACLLAAGVPNKEICAKLRLVQGRLSQLKKDPLIVERARELRQEYIGSTLEEILGTLQREAGPSIKTMMEIRDDVEVDPTARLRAAEKMAFDGYLDRVAPKKMRGDEDSKKTIHIHIDSEMGKGMLAAMAEVGEIVDVEAIPVELPLGEVRRRRGRPVKGEQKALPAPVRVEPRTVEELLEEQEEAGVDVGL